MEKNSQLTIAELKRALSYNPETRTIEMEI